MIEGISIADMTPRQMSEFLAGVSPSLPSLALVLLFWLDKRPWAGGWGGSAVCPETLAALLLGPQLTVDFTPPLANIGLQSDVGIHGLSPGDETTAFLSAKRRQLKLLNAALLAGLSLAARGVDAASHSLIGVPAGCLSLLLLVSTVASGSRQVEALARAPMIERLVAREQAAAGWSAGAGAMPESYQA